MSTPLAERLRDTTRPLHAEVERSGIMVPLLRGKVSRTAYAGLLRNLHAIYAALEAGLEQHAAHPAIAPWFERRLFRTAALADDLARVHGPRWSEEIVLVDAAWQYAAHLRQLTQAQPQALAAHAYVRYLGDLSGGQVLARVVTGMFGLRAGGGVRFYDFGTPAETRQLAQDLRSGLNRLPVDDATAQALLDEACAAFVRHKHLFEQLGHGAEALG